MNYLKIYESLIASAIKRPLIQGYTEKHHILPKSMGGNDSIDNLVTLTAREHFIAHLLLARIFKNREMWSAAYMMASTSLTNSDRHRCSSHLYELLRKQASVYNSGENSPNWGIKRSEETRLKMSISKMGIRNPMYGIPQCLEHSHKISLGVTEAFKNPEMKERHRQSVSGENNGFYGKKHSEKSLEKQRNTKRKGFPWDNYLELYPIWVSLNCPKHPTFTNELVKLGYPKKKLVRIVEEFKNEYIRNATHR